MKRIPSLSIIAAAALAAALSGCTKEPAWHPAEKEGFRKELTLSCEPLDTETADGTPTRSNHSAGSLTQVTNVNYYLFRNGSFVKQEYCPDISTFAVDLPSITAKYNLYLLANVGQVTIPTTTAESAMGTAVHYDYGSKSKYFSTISSNGFPMANVVKNFTASSSSQYQLRRLVHTLYVKMNTEELQKTKMTFTGVQIKQAPRDVYPFAESKATATMDGDAANLSSDDIDRLNSGETVTLYLLENMRGDLIAGNTSWKNKIPSRISATAERSRASYIEMTARVQTATAVYENNIYRAYLGNDASNFDVERSTYFILNNNFTSDMVHDEDWRVDPGTPTITGRLCFADTRFTYDTAPAAYRNYTTEDLEYRPFQEVESFYTMKGFTAVYYIYRSSPDIDYTISVNKASTVEPYVSYRTSKIDDHFTAIMIKTQMPISTTDSYYYTGVPTMDGTKDVVLTVRSADGLLEDKLTVKVLYKPLGVYFHYDNAAKAVATTDDGILNMYMSNALMLRINVKITGTLNGYVSYKPSGTMWGSQSQSPEVHIKTGGTYNVKVGPVRMDTYQDNTNYGGTVISNRAGFFEYFKQIWNTTGWDSYTALNGSNGYHKHAHPTKLQLALTMTFDSPNSRRLKPDNGLVLPINWCNKEYKTNDSGVGYGAGTDWGFEWDHFDKEGTTDYDRYRFIKHVNTPNQSLYSYECMVPVGIKINSTEKWTTDKKGIPLAVQYSDSYFSDLGF